MSFYDNRPMQSWGHITADAGIEPSVELPQHMHYILHIHLLLSKPETWDVIQMSKCQSRWRHSWQQTVRALQELCLFVAFFFCFVMYSVYCPFVWSRCGLFTYLHLSKMNMCLMVAPSSTARVYQHRFWWGGMSARFDWRYWNAPGRLWFLRL